MRTFAATVCLLLLGSSCSKANAPAPEPAPTSPVTSEPSPMPPPAQSAGQAGADGSPAPSKAGPAGAACGGIAGFGCAAGLYCAFAPEAQCGAADQTGICAAIPEMCTEEFAPVCGCNDKTYPNACYAAREGVSVASRNECAKPAALAEGQTCGSRGIAGDCGPGLYCEFKASNCGADDRGGVCTKRPQMCTKIYAPVCGCDGKTHPSACTAAAAGVSVASKGECKP